MTKTTLIAVATITAFSAFAEDINLNVREDPRPLSPSQKRAKVANAVNDAVAESTADIVASLLSATPAQGDAITVKRASLVEVKQTFDKTWNDLQKADECVKLLTILKNMNEDTIKKQAAEITSLKAEIKALKEKQN